jgi:hypothetical protein
MLFLLKSRKTPSLLWCASSLLARSSFVNSFYIPQSARDTTRTTRHMSSSSSSNIHHSINGKKIVSISDAIQAHQSPHVKFVDGSWFLTGRNARDEFEQGPRIEGAAFFDIDDIATPSLLRHMMPSKQLFAAAMDKMGMKNDDHIIVYGSKDCVSMKTLPVYCSVCRQTTSSPHAIDVSLFALA